MPLAVPLETEFIRVLRRAHEPLRHRGFRFCLSGDLEHAIQRTVGLTGHVAGYIDDRQQILVIDIVIPRPLPDCYDFG